MTPLRCPHCGRGNLHLEPVIPGLFDVICLLCSRTAGEVIADDLFETWGADALAVAEAEMQPLSFLWATN